MPMGAAAYVSANFLHKKERVACTLLKVLMRYYARLGTPIGCLHPFNPAFYRRMGYGNGNEYVLYQPKPCYIRSFGDKSGLSYAAGDDRAAVLAFYRRWAERTHGATVHPYMDPHRIFDAPYVVVCRREGRITGYLTFSFVEVDHYTDMYHDLMVHEMIYEDMDTLKQFMTFFASQVDQIERVRILSPDRRLHLMFTNPDTGENRAHDGCIHEIGRRAMGYMVRIFDVAGYFRLQPRCRRPAERPFVLALRVADDFLPENDRVFLLRVEGGLISLVEHAQPDVTLSLGISPLSSAVMGALSLKEAVDYGLAQISDPAWLEELQNAIGWEEPPVNVTYF